MKLRRDQSLLLGAAALAVMLWAIDPLRPLLLPLIYLNTHLHELCHGIMGVLTGARVDHIVVRADGSGYALMAGGSIIPMASAGYVGTAVLGGILMAVARKGENARLALATLAGSLGFGMVLWVRGDVIGVISGLFWVGLLWLLSRKLTADQATWSVQFFGRPVGAYHGAGLLGAHSAQHQRLRSHRCPHFARGHGDPRAGLVGSVAGHQCGRGDHGSAPRLEARIPSDRLTRRVSCRSACFPVWMKSSRVLPKLKRNSQTPA